MTGKHEPQDKTEAFVERTKAAYAYAYDPGALGAHFKVSGIPHAVLVDASGLVVWEGNPGGLTDDVVESALVGALPEPVYTWPEEASKVRQYLLKRQVYKAVAEAQKLEGEGAAKVRTALETLVSGSVRAFQAHLERGDYLAAVELSERLAKELKGLPELAEVEKGIEELEQDDAAQDVLEAQEKVRGISKKRVKKGNVDRYVRQLEKIAEEHPGTAAERDARALIRKLRAS